MPDLRGHASPFARFNVFRALRLDAHEIRHSNFLGWLLDPTESHGQGDLFLRSFIRLILPDGPSDLGVRTPEEFLGAEVKREHDLLDIRIVLPKRRLVVGVENKVFAKEHSDQLARYAVVIARDFPGWQQSFVYLTLDAERPSDDRWRAISHRSVCEMIVSGNTQLAPATPSEVRSFIQHYLDLISDIYGRRTAAAETPRSPEVMQTIAEAIKSRPGWQLVSRSSSIIECGPVGFFESLPGIAAKTSRDPRQWLTLRFHDHGARGYVGRYWRPCEVSDMSARNAILRALVEQGDATGFRYKAGPLNSGLSKVEPAFSGDQIQDVRTGKMPSLPLLRELIDRELSAVDARLPELCRVVKHAAVK